MTYTLYKLENTRARLCRDRMTTTDKSVVDMVRAMWEAQGYIVTMDTER